MKLLIKNGRVIDPATNFDEVCDLAVAAGRIIAIGRIAADFHPNRVIDASGCIVAPGLVDLAVRPMAITLPAAMATSPVWSSPLAGSISLPPLMSNFMLRFLPRYS